LEHVDWEGFHFYDLIFPMFVFITGTSTVFSITRRLQTDSKPKILGKIIWRTVFLYALGLFYYAGMEQIQNYGDLRYMGVLQRIAIAYGFGAALFLYLPTRFLIATFAAILIGYYLAVAFIPFEGSSELTYSQRFEEGSAKNLVNYVDSKILKGYKWNGDHDPEGLLSNVPAVGSCLLGIFAGLLLINPEKKKLWKFSMLLLMGLACLGLAFGWGLFFPIIKKLWTSSFVLMAGGWSFLLLAFFYLLIDIWGLKFWAWPFVWIGSNAITIYIMWELIDFTGLAGRIIQFKFADMLGIYAPFAKYLLALFFAISILRFLYKKKVHIRI
jgi:predicted acyltransferase